MIEIVDFIMPGIHLMEEIRHMADLQYSQGTMDRLDGHHCHLDGLPMNYILFRTDRPYRKEHQLWQWLIHLQSIQIIVEGILIAVY